MFMTQILELEHVFCLIDNAGSGKLVAFITGVPARLRVRQAELATVEINFLCVHKKLRQKRLAPVLIKVKWARGSPVAAPPRGHELRLVQALHGSAFGPD